MKLWSSLTMNQYSRAKAIKHQHSEAEAEVVGRAEANRVASFMAGLEDKALSLALRGDMSIVDHVDKNT